MQFLFIIDPLPELKAYKDTTVTMMRAAQARGHGVFVCEQPGIAWRAGGVTAETTRIALTDPSTWNT
jgi:glutathione synthase